MTPGTPLNIRFAEPRLGLEPGWAEERSPINLFSQLHSLGASETLPPATTLFLMRGGEITIAVLVPWRTDNGHRERLWNHLQAFYWRHLAEFAVFIGESPSGEFNRSAALNDAARKAGSWELAVIADSDSWVPPVQLLHAAVIARETGKLTAAFTDKVELSQTCTELLLTHSCSVNSLGIDAIFTDPMRTQSSMLAVTRDLWDDVGGFDERFVGWGGEDNAFWRSCTILAGEPARILGRVFHLWHPPASTKQHSDRCYQTNLALWGQYQQAQTRQDLLGIVAPDR